MPSKVISHTKINSIIERFFVTTSIFMLITALSVGLYFNKHEEEAKKNNNLQKTHSMLAQLIVPSLIISDLSEVRRLLGVASSKKEAFLVIDNDGLIIMPDYEKNNFNEFVARYYKSFADCKNLEFTYRYVNGKDYLINCSVLTHVDVRHVAKKAGVLLSFSSYSWFSFSPLIFYFLGILVGLLFVLIILFRRILYRNLLKPLVILKDRILSISSSNSILKPHIENIDNAPQELVEIKEVFEKLFQTLNEEYSKRTQAEKMRALIDLAASVAHDIRSPLVALDVIIKDIKNIPEDKRILIRSATNRINDIANNLLTQYSKKIGTEMQAISNKNPELISDLIVRLVSEKRVQYRGRNINLTLNIDENSYGRFANLSASTFNRVMSNLIDNSIEAFAKDIEINVSLPNVNNKDLLSIQIQDNGCGISPEALIKISDGVAISSKPKGHGLGLLSSIKSIEKDWDGQFHIQSVIDTGTTIKIELPQVSPPKWFLFELIVSATKPIIILDDDESIHRVWKDRFNKLYSHFNYIDFYDPSEFLFWYRNSSVQANLFLIDFEFIGLDKNGLNVIEELNIADKSCLVTSRYDDLSLRERCNEIGLKIIPKTFAGHIPIILSKKNNNIINCDLIFIDDCEVITQAWVLHGLSVGKKIVSYNSADAFKEDLNKFDLSTPIYVDSDLKDVMNGQDFAKELYEYGFKYIWLSTGHPADKFPKMYWIKEVVGKMPPF